MKPNISIDFDGVIHDLNNIPSGRIMGKPMEGAKEALTILSSYYHILIWSVRANTESGKKSIKNWMEYFEIPYDEITNEKIKSSYYIDDHGLRFDSWKHILEEITL